MQEQTKQANARLNLFKVLHLRFIFQKH